MRIIAVYQCIAEKNVSIRKEEGWIISERKPWNLGIFILISVVVFGIANFATFFLTRLVGKWGHALGGWMVLIRLVLISAIIVVSAVISLKISRIGVKFKLSDVSLKRIYELPLAMAMFLVSYIGLRSLFGGFAFRELSKADWESLVAFVALCLACEMTFRGIIYRSLSELMSDSLATLVSSSIFAYSAVVFLLLPDFDLTLWEIFLGGAALMVYSIFMTVVFKVSGGVWWGAGMSGANIFIFRMDDTRYLPFLINAVSFVLVLVILRRKKEDRRGIEA